MKKIGIDDAVIFTDGSSRGNPGPGGWAAVIVDPQNVNELGGSESHTTNNRMEIMAAVQGLQKVQAKNITLYTDSSYLINGATKWVFGWKKNGWKTSTKEDVLNKDLWEDLLEVMSGKNIQWTYVGGHVGIVGNERCDEIATVSADGGDAQLYSGKSSEYQLQNILDIDPVALDVTKKSDSKKRSSAAAYSYISKVDGLVMVHHSWRECEARVKGKSGALFKKSLSKEDEGKIVTDFTSR
ncbi:MAG: ribonuclease HI [Candidatus Taylorbacteria bacterium]|nr:ribonuclease HI [Candidatus Taylorbacteria bacterium]